MALMTVVPMAVGAATVCTPEETAFQQAQDITISYSDGTLYITGGENCQLEIVSLTGKRVMQLKIESPAQKVELNIPKGCYIVKIGDVVRKISVR